MINIDTVEKLIPRDAKRKRPMYDKEVHDFLSTMQYTNFAGGTKLINEYKEKFHQWVLDHKLVKLQGLESFPDKKVCIGVTNAINDLYVMNQNKVVIFEGDFFYHEVLFPNITKRTVDTLQTGDVLLISMPFCGETYGVHPSMDDILETCLSKNIPVHIDAAWFPCSKGITFNVDHPAIVSVTTSLTKAYGISEHRCGMRYTRKTLEGPVQYMNDNNFMAIPNLYTGIKFMDKFGTDFWWNKYGKHYDNIISQCKNLAPSPAIHVAFSTHDDGRIKKAVPMKQALLFLEYGITEGSLPR